MPQTTVTTYQNQWLCEGQIADTTIRRIDGSMQGYYTPSGSILPFGRVVVKGTGSTIALPTAAASSQRPLGITIFNERHGIDIPSMVATAANTTLIQMGFPPNTAAPEVLTFGDVVMWTEEAVNVGDAVLYRYTAAASPKDQLGRVAKTASAGNLDALPNAVFLTGTSGAGLVVVRLVQPLAGV